MRIHTLIVFCALALFANTALARDHVPVREGPHSTSLGSPHESGVYTETSKDGYHNSGGVTSPTTREAPALAPYSKHSRNRNPHTKANGPESPYHDYNTTPKAYAPPPAAGGYYRNSGQVLGGGSARPWRSY